MSRISWGLTSHHTGTVPLCSMVGTTPCIDLTSMRSSRPDCGLRKVVLRDLVFLGRVPPGEGGLWRERERGQDLHRPGRAPHGIHLRALRPGRGAGRLPHGVARRRGFPPQRALVRSPSGPGRPPQPSPPGHAGFGAAKWQACCDRRGLAGGHLPEDRGPRDSPRLRDGRLIWHQPRLGRVARGPLRSRRPCGPGERAGPPRGARQRGGLPRAGSRGGRRGEALTAQDPADTGRGLLTLGTATLAESGGSPLPPRIRAVWAGASLAAPALTVWCRPGDNLAVHVGVAAAQQGQALVVAVAGTPDRGYWGGVLTTAAEARG